jgi:hypothetical protein
LRLPLRMLSPPAMRQTQGTFRLLSLQKYLA